MTSFDVELPMVGRQCVTGHAAVMVAWLVANQGEINPAALVTVTLHIGDKQLSPNVEKHLPKVNLVEGSGSSGPAPWARR